MTIKHKVNLYFILMCNDSVVIVGQKRGFMFTTTQDYHMATKHSYYSVRSMPNRLDWDNQPWAFKSYPESYLHIPLNLELESHSFLYYIASIDAKKSYPGVEYYLRINPSAGALYPNEIYFQSRNNEGLDDGIYHLNIAHNAITLLKPIKEEGIEPFLHLNNQIEGFIFLNSALYYRSAWKYKNRAFRYCLLDSGHLLGCIENSCYVHEKEYELVYDFDKKRLNTMFGFSKEEFFLSACVVGKTTQNSVLQLQMNLENIDGTGVFENNVMIEEAYEKSIHIHNKTPQYVKPQFHYSKEIFKEVILKRRSIRGFEKRAILKEQLHTLLSLLNQPIPSDCDEQIDIYYVINRVKEMPLGLYKNGELIIQGDFASKAGYLCLEQELGAHSAVTFFLTSSSKNYQAMYQKAGIIGHRLYSGSNYMHIGCSGIGAYYDDEVCEFINENTQVLYALAIGH